MGGMDGMNMDGNGMDMDDNGMDNGMSDMEGMGDVTGGMTDGMEGMTDGMDGTGTKRRKKRHGGFMHDIPGLDMGMMMGSDMNMTSMMHNHVFENGWAILSYTTNSSDDAQSSSDYPQSSATNCTQSEPCRVFSCPSKMNLEPGYECIGIGESEAHEDIKDSQEAEFGVVEDEPVHEYFLNFGFAVSRYKGSSISSRKFVHPTAPMYQTNINYSHIVPCDPDSCKYGCKCTHMLKVPTGVTVQLVITNIITMGSEITAHHPVHIHGHGFAVLKVQETTEDGMNSPDIKCYDGHCTDMGWKSKPDLNFDSPPIKDTLLVPVHGYAVVRFRTDNPGFWFLHCHQQQHMEDGMALIIMVSNLFIHSLCKKTHALSTR